MDIQSIVVQLKEEVSRIAQTDPLRLWQNHQSD